MDITELIEGLSDPGAYPEQVRTVEVRQTHISVVFLTEHHVYKIKKPVSLSFLDFSTLESRLHDCNEEARLNRRLAPDVYLGVVPVVSQAGQLRLEADGEPVEWAVKMVRLPDEATIRSRLTRDEVTPELLILLARRLAKFHAEAHAGKEVSACGHLEVVGRNARENFAESVSQVGVSVTEGVFTRARERTEQAMEKLGPLIQRRAEQNVPRDTHGDLHLSHVYYFPDQPEEKQLVILDCVEFNNSLRYADPVADMAFLVMDLLHKGRPDLAVVFQSAYFAQRQDEEGKALVPFYTAYRAAVRGKVEGMKAREEEIPEEERAAACKKAEAYWLLCLGQLEEPAQRPCLILVSGLPGAGKSTLARGLAEKAGLAWIRSDLVRKELAGLPPQGPGAAGDQSLYTPAWTEKTYATCRQRAETLLRQGGRVVVDATFRDEKQRQTFLQLGQDLGIPALLFQCHVRAEIATERLSHRQGDPSDADANVLDQLTHQWEEPAPATLRLLQPISTEAPPEEVLQRALAILTEKGLFQAK